MPPWITLASSPRTMPRAGHLCSLEASHTYTQNKRLRKRLSSDRYTHRLAAVSTIRYTCSQINMDVLLGRHIQGWTPYTQSYRHTHKMSYTDTYSYRYTQAHRAANYVELQPFQFLPSRVGVLPHLLPQVAPPNPGTAQ